MDVEMDEVIIGFVDTPDLLYQMLFQCSFSCLNKMCFSESLKLCRVVFGPRKYVQVNTRYCNLSGSLLESVHY